MTNKTILTPIAKSGKNNLLRPNPKALEHMKTARDGTTYPNIQYDLVMTFDEANLEHKQFLDEVRRLESEATKGKPAVYPLLHAIVENNLNPVTGEEKEVETGRYWIKFKTKKQPMMLTSELKEENIDEYSLDSDDERRTIPQKSDVHIRVAFEEYEKPAPGLRAKLLAVGLVKKNENPPSDFSQLLKNRKKDN